MFSRIAGLLRESVVSAVFGAGAAMDAFNVAYRIPNLLRDMVAEGALGSAFTKVYSATSTEDPERARRLLVDTIYLAALVGLVVCALGIAFSGPLVDLVTSPGPGRGPDFAKHTTALTQLLFPVVGILSVAAIVTGALHQRGQFFLSAMSPVVFNIANIIGALWLSGVFVSNGPDTLVERFGDKAILGLAIGVLVGALLQLLLVTGGIWRPLLAGHFRPSKLIPWSPDIAKVVVLMGPMVIASSAGQINVIVNTNFATSLDTGAVTWLANAFRFLQLPIGLFGVAIGAAVLPALSAAIARAGRRVDKVASDEIVNAIDLVLWLTLPCLVFLVATNHAVIDLFYRAGRYTAADSEATAAALHAYAFGLVAYGLIKVMTSYYYAVDRTRFAMIVSMVSIGINYAGNSLLAETYGHVGLALTTSITLSLNALLLVIGMSRDSVQIPWPRVLRSFGILVIAAVVAFGILHIVKPLGTAVEQLLGGLADGSRVKATLALKASALAEIFVHGFAVGAPFIVCAMWRLRAGPRDLISRVKKLRRRNNTAS